MRHLAVALVVLIGAPVVAQPATNLSKPSPGLQAPVAVTETEEELARRWESEQGLSAVRLQPVLDAANSVTTEDLLATLAEERALAETPLPPPCEPPLPRSPPEQPGPPPPCPAPR